METIIIRSMVKIAIDSSLLTYGRAALNYNPSTTYPTNGLLARWDFDGDLTDSQGNNDFVNTGGTNVSYDTGKIGQCITFLPTDSPPAQIEVTTNTILEFPRKRAPFTMSWWWKGDPSTGVASTKGFLNMRYYSDNGIYTDTIEMGTLFGDSDITNWHYIGRYPHNSTDVNLCNAASNPWEPETNTWYHTIYSYDPVTAKGYMYVNNGAFTLDTSTAVQTNEMSQPYPSYFRVDGTDSGDQTATYIDMLYIYDRVLTADERSMLWNDGDGI